MPTTDTFVCDTCGQIIEKPEHGWVEWISLVGKKPGRNFRLVHHKPRSPNSGESGCQFNQAAEFAEDKGIVSDLPLTYFMGSNGLMSLLSMINQNDVPVDEVVEMIKRIHIPGYERARFYFKEAIDNGVFEPNMPENFYWQSDIEDTLKFAEDK
ncbi:MAG: hypothetical protein JRF71_15300 [Deltaproteobacteria bacterium]|nr:hypothetical protein [Deltaproteobacteria bacterium]